MTFEDTVKFVRAVKSKASQTKKKAQKYWEENQLEIILGVTLGLAAGGTMLGYLNLYEIEQMKKTKILKSAHDYVDIWDETNGWWVRVAPQYATLSDEKFKEMLKAKREDGKSITEFFLEQENIPFKVMSTECK